MTAVTWAHSVEVERRAPFRPGESRALKQAARGFALRVSAALLPAPLHSGFFLVFCLCLFRGIGIPGNDIQRDECGKGLETKQRVRFAGELRVSHRGKVFNNRWFVSTAQSLVIVFIGGRCPLCLGRHPTCSAASRPGGGGCLPFLSLSFGRRTRLLVCLLLFWSLLKYTVVLKKMLWINRSVCALH